MKKIIFTSAALLLSMSANAAKFDLTNYADAVVDYTQGTGVGHGENATDLRDPTQALGAENFESRHGNITSLGDGGSLVLQFTDNALVASGDSDYDLWVGEVGDGDNYSVSISADNNTWYEVGTASTESFFDIDSNANVFTNILYSFVKIIDLSPSSTVFPASGADIDAVAAVNYASPSAVPVPAAAFLFAPALIGFMGLRRKAAKKA